MCTLHGAPVNRPLHYVTTASIYPQEMTCVRSQLRRNEKLFIKNTKTDGKLRGAASGLPESLVKDQSE